MSKNAGRYVLIIAAVFILATALIMSRMPKGPAPAEPVSIPSVRGSDALARQMVRDIEAFALGEHALRDLGMPQEFLERVADHVIRASYRERFHVVYRDRGAAPDATGPSSAVVVDPPPISIVSHDMTADRVAVWEAMPELRPTNRGFRAPILGGPWSEPDLDSASWSDRQRAAADIVATRLAPDGLLVALARVLEVIEATGDAGAQVNVAQLDELGFPTDLLRCFGADASAVIDDVRGRLAIGGLTETLERELAAMPFRFVPSDPTFRCAPENGVGDTQWLRGQLTRGTYWQGVGAGGCLDVVRQVVEQLPEAAVTLSVQEQFVAALPETIGAWALRSPSSLTIVVEPLAVAQWAQDNAKIGAVREDGQVRPALLAPRYASRREDGSLFIAGESALMDGLAQHGVRGIHSPLVFQGGNLLCVVDPVEGQRILFVGEAEIYRNTALGLSEHQVMRAFAVEFGADRCVVLPAVSFHIDYDVTLRVHDGAIIAFVNDTDAAVRLILEAGVQALRKAGLLDVAAGDELRRRIAAGDDKGVLDMIAPAVFRQANADAQYPLSLAQSFEVSWVDSGVGNLQRFLVAVDMLASRVVTDHPDAVTGTYLESYRRSDRDRTQLHAVLRSLGFEICLIPSLADADRSINAINGLQLGDRYLMPAYGGLYANLDAAAAAAFAQRLGTGVEIVPILSAESQRRGGAVHCSLAAYPDPAQWYPSEAEESPDRADPVLDDRRRQRGAPEASRP